ncbi:MAG: PEGA domain-containing protein [Phycisphaerae bacterium]
MTAVALVTRARKVEEVRRPAAMALCARLAGKAPLSTPTTASARLKGALHPVLLALLAAVTTFSGCVRRTIIITTDPPGALVTLNDQEIGRSEVATDFVWYGDYTVTLRNEGYETLKTNLEVKPPWYQHMPVDFFAEVLWPWQIHDVHTAHFAMRPMELPAVEDLITRATETRERALDRRR